MSRSPGDVQPVFDAIARLGREAARQVVHRRAAARGRMYRLAAMYSGAHRGRAPPEAALVAIDPAATSRRRCSRAGGRCTSPSARRRADAADRNVKAHLGIASSLMLPLLRGDTCVAVLFIGRNVPRAFTDREIALAGSFVDRGDRARERAAVPRDPGGARAADRDRRDPEGAQRIADRHPPVFRAIVDAAFRLFDLAVAGLAQREGDGYRMMSMASATHAAGAPSARLMAIDACDLPFEGHPVEGDAPSAGLVGHRAAVVRAAHLRRGRHPRSLMLPILRGDECVGGLGVSRKVARAFTVAEIAAMQSFVDQAAIAIENVRLFNETREALGRQTAMADVLQVSAARDGFASGLEAILQRCEGLFPDAAGGAMSLIGDDGLAHARLRSHRAWTQLGRHARRCRAAAQQARSRRPGRSKGPPPRWRSSAGRRSIFRMPFTVPMCRATFATRRRCCSAAAPPTRWRWCRC